MMEKLGKIKDREIFYLSLRDNLQWEDSLPTEKWVVFTIADKEDEKYLSSSTEKILNKNVTYTCSAGELASLTEDFFDEQIGWKGVQFEEKTGKKYDFGVPMTSMHKNFGEGFWFATVLASDGEEEIDKVVCLDFTKRKVKRHLSKLIEKINIGWLPTNNEIELAEYDLD